jgi:hypothetical protein
VKADLQAAYNEQMQKDIEAVEPWMDGCNGYYRSASGRVVTQWPKNMTAFKEMIADLDPEAYETQSI